MTVGARGPFKRPLLLLAMGLIGGLFLVELAVRVETGSILSWQPKEGNEYADVDPLLGRIPKPGLSVRHPPGFDINIGEHGTRSNGDTPAPAERPLTVVVGDSFAFGDGVGDEDSWPAILEHLTKRRVINGAVPGFGLDQIVLRAEQLAAVYSPDTIVVSFIPHDVLRCEMSYWSGHSKPYFEIEGAGLRLQPAAEPPASALAWLKRLLSVSSAANLFFPKFLYWQGPEATVVHRRGREVGCLLMERLAALGRARHLRIVVLAQPQQATPTPEQVEIKNKMLACAAANPLLVVDLFPAIDRFSPEERKQLFPRHMSAEGNRLVATELAEFLERQQSTR